MDRARGAFIGLLLSCVFASALAAEPSAPGPLSPRGERAAFRVPSGFKVELVACEPDVVDPVAMAFDEDGRIYVCEMRGYPNAGVGTGDISSGRIRLLEDRDGDGFYETSTLFADNLRFPTSVMPWKGGVLVANSPELIYLKDTKGTGHADERRTLYTGFELANIQHLLNSLQWGMDNWVYACAGSNGGTIRSAEKPDTPPITLRNRGLRFHPDQPGSLEPTSGGGQYGLAADEWGQWFTATNSQHLRHIVLPDHYLRRNPLLPVSAVTLDIPDHGAACEVHRISPFEAWRVERTTRRREGPDAQRFPSTELVPGGYITSACSPVVYTADRFPEAYRGNTFVCDPANNLLHRDLLEPHGATFVAKRADAEREFLASTDNWFRPVWISLGPDGALYVLDFYREVIETPLSLPDDIKKKLNLESRGRGRIWRVRPDDTAQAKRPVLSRATSAQLVRHLTDANAWWRLTAQRLLVERQDRGVEPALRKGTKCATPVDRVHALWTLHGLGLLADTDIERGLEDDAPGVREQALRLAEERLAKSNDLLRLAVKLADDPSPRVRFQLAFSLGASPAPEATTALARVARHDFADPWMQTAVLSSASRSAPAMLENLARDAEFIKNTDAGRLQFLTRLAALASAGGKETDLGRALALLSTQRQTAQPWQIAILQGLGQGLQNSSRPLNRMWDDPPPALREAVERAKVFFQQAIAVAKNDKQPAAERRAAAQLLGYAPFAQAGPVLQGLLTPQTDADLQLAAVRALAQHDQSRVAEALLASWNSYGPTLRREALEALLARPGRVQQLLDAIERKQILAGQLEPARVEQLRKHPNAKIRRRAQALLAGRTSDRQKVLDEYRPALEFPADVTRGKAVFKKNCATCHRLENEGIEVGPDLLSALRNKTPETLLFDILDPSRDVDPRYINYQITTKSGRVFTGLIAAETASSVTLRRAEKAEDTLLRGDIDEISATSKSLMPEGLEMQLSKQEVADVIAYLQMIGKAK
jgi:putative membrane-bound dehydrogenase-like protein